MSVKATDYFNDFVHNISLSDMDRKALQEAHTSLRSQLKDDPTANSRLITTFIQGSYARSTGIKPSQDKKVDVDVIAVTDFGIDTSARAAFMFFYPFMENHYGSVSLNKQDTSTTVHQQSRSIGIELPKVDIDFVPTSAPSMALNKTLQHFAHFNDFTVEGLDNDTRASAVFEQAFRNDPTWKDEPLRIPDYDDNRWDRTHPLEQIRQTREKNKLCNRHFLAVVKSIKWWKRVNLPGQKHPQSYPLERFVGFCCPDGIESIAEGIVCTFEKIVTCYPVKPFLPDYGVPEHDVFERLSSDDYNTFYQKVCEMAPLARAAYDASDMETAVKLWRQFFANCEEFPNYSGPSSCAGLVQKNTNNTAASTVRFG